MNTTQNYGMAALAIIILMMASGEVHRAFAVTPMVHGSTAPTGIANQYPQGMVFANTRMQGPHNPQIKYGLVQTGVFGVARADQNGQFGTPTAMPVFQLIQLQAPQRTAALQPNMQPQVGPQGHRQAPQLQPMRSNAPQADLPPGISVSGIPATQIQPTQCEINTIQVLTPSAKACVAAGGKVMVQSQ